MRGHDGLAEPGGYPTARALKQRVGVEVMPAGELGRAPCERRRDGVSQAEVDAVVELGFGGF